MTLLALTSSSTFLLILGFVFYLIIVRLEKLKQNKAELEIILFSFFLALWFQFIIYKNAFLENGLAVIWQNTPLKVLSVYFTEVGIIEALFNIGMIPLIFGVYIIYKYTLKEKSREIYLFIGMALATSLLLWFRLIQQTISLTFLGIILSILFAQFYKDISSFIHQTKFERFKKHILTTVILLFIISSLFPAFIFTENKIHQAPSLQETEALMYIKDNSGINDTVLGTLRQGYFITAIAERKNVIDFNFLLAPKPSQRLNDVERIYQTQYKTEAIPLLNKYNVNFILFSDQTKKELKIDQIEYINDEKCFEQVFNKNNVQVFKSTCIIE